jgi:hypothetical protein
MKMRRELRNRGKQVENNGKRQEMKVEKISNLRTN